MGIVGIFIQISLQSLAKGPINNKPLLVETMAGCRTGDKPLSEPLMATWAWWGYWLLSPTFRYTRYPCIVNPVGWYVSSIQNLSNAKGTLAGIHHHYTYLCKSHSLYCPLILFLIKWLSKQHVLSNWSREQPRFLGDVRNFTLHIDRTTW